MTTARLTSTTKRGQFASAFVKFMVIYGRRYITSIPEYQTRRAYDCSSPSNVWTDVLFGLIATIHATLVQTEELGDTGSTMV